MDAKMLVLLSLVAAAMAGPLSTHDSNNKCATECIESTNFKYTPGTTYVYDYKVDTDSSLAGAFEQSAKTTIQTTAHIEVLSPCEFSLQLRNTELFHTDGSAAMKTCDRESAFRTEVEQAPLRFSFQNGVVDHVCGDKDDSVRALNLKKGLLSAFQNGMTDLTKGQNVTETDVVGTCKAEYKLVSNGYYTTEVKKVKDILSCTDRLDFQTMFQLTPYTVPSDLQNVPIMKTSHECDQKIENGGVLKTSVCKESHVYRPFANGESGARTTVTQTLTYQTYRSGVSPRSGNVASRSSLLFDHSADHPTKEQSRSAVEQKLNEVCDSTSSSLRPETPRLFTQLVAAMKGLDKTDLTELHRLLKTEEMCPTNGRAYKFFHDALPMMKTKASVGLMTDLINTKDVKGMEATAWLTSLAFIQDPTSDMLLDVKTLLDNEEVRADAMLPVSSMVNNFCRKMGTCNQDNTVLRLVSSLERNIDYSCDASGSKFELTLLTLKAIGNAGHAIRAVPVLNKCMTSSSNPLEIRVAAAEAFRRMSCGADNTELWNTFSDSDLDSELRINAYLALMRCPTQENLAKIATILSTEEDEQVGAFVYSHLTNLRETSDPHKQDVAESINNLALEKEFDISPLKFSRNFEVSALLNKINTGVTAESNLIWSNKVQLPRAVSANLTVQLFGQSINLLDFGGRLEGLEYLIKNIFGPYVNANEKSKMDADSVKGSFYGRMFGNEMLFMHSQTTKSLFGDKTPTYLDMLIKMADRQHIALTQSVQFLDICMVIPSSAGLPIHLNVNGTATVDLNMSGKMDLRKVGASPRSMDVDGEIRPSAAMEVTGSMFVDAFVAKTGLRMRNTLHTSTAIKGRIQMTRGQQLNVELDTPLEKMEIFDARSKFFLIHDGIEQEQEMIKENRKEFKVCSGSKMTQITGMEVCGELSFPNASMKADSPYFPLTGPTSASVTLFKRDSHSGYKLFAKRVENRRASMAQISFNTPGSSVDRAISLDMTLNYKKQDIEMNLASPWKKLAVNGNLMNSKDLKSLKGSVVIDDQDTYAMTGEVKVSQSKTKIQINPMIELRRPGADNVQVTGFMSMEKPFKAVDMGMSLSGIKHMPYTMKAALSNTNKEKSVEASVSLDGKKEYSFKASNKVAIMGKKTTIAVINSLLEVASPQRKLMTLSNDVDYREDKSLKLTTNLYMYRVLKKPAVLKVNVLKTARKKSTNYKSVMNLKTSHVSGSIVCSINKKPSGFLSVTSKVDYTIPKVAKNTINLSGKLNDRSTKAYKSYIVQSNFGIKKNPEYNNVMKIELGHKKKLSYASADVKYGANPKDKTKRVYLLTSVNRKVASIKNALINYKLKAQAPAHNVDVLLQGKHEHSPKLLDTTATLTYAPKKAVSAGLTLRNKGAKLAKINGKAALSWPGQEYLINTDLTQKSAKQYAHALNFKSSSGIKHTISTLYKTPSSDSHDVATTFMLHGMKPVTLSGSTKLNPKNFAASGEVKTGGKVYGINTIAKFSKNPNAKLGLELIHPARRVTLDVTGGKGRGKYEGSVETAWDADNDKSQKMGIDGSFFQKSAKGSVSLGGNVNFQSPFSQFENLLGSFKYGMDPSKHAVTGKVMWGDKTDQIMSTMTVKRPFNLNNMHFNGNVKTPFRGFRNAEIDIAHKMDSGLSTTITGDLDKESAKLAIQGQKVNNGFKGNMNLKSTIKNAESVALSASHTGNEGSCNSNAELNHNGKVYGYDLTMSHSGDGWQRESSGDLVLTLRKQKIATHWDHKNTDASVKSSLSSKWDKNRLVVDLIGSHELSSLRNINGVLKIKSPWMPVRDIELNLDHKHGPGLIDSVAFMKQGSHKKASSVINYKSGQNSHDFDFMIASPFHEDLSGKLNTDYNTYPMTTSAEMKWAPKRKGTVEGSLDLTSWNNADLNVKMTTPSRTLRNVVLKASNKKQNGEIVSNLNLDYGMRQNIDVESRISNEDQNKMLRFKVNSPFEQIKSLNTGLKFNGNSDKFDTTVDFELLPIVGKFDGAVNWQYGDEMNGKVRVDTPFPEYPFFELATSSNKEGALTKTHIQAEYHPRQVYSLDSTYNFGSPLSFDATIRSPYPEFDDIGMSIQHNMADSSVKSHGEVRYQPSKKIEADVDADWSSNLEGNFVVKTPFSGYENNKISMRHRGDLQDFDTHGEIDVAEQNVVADASFKSGYTTTGTFTFSSPIPGMESIDVSLRKKGPLHNVKGGATVTVNGEKVQTTFTNKMMKDSLKTNFNLMTSQYAPFKFAIDHSGPIDSFTNKVNFNYGRKVDIDTIASFDVRDNDVNGNGILKYKLGNGRNTARVSFSKNGPIEDVTFTSTASFNRDDITVTGTLRTTGGFDGSVQIKTPFNNFKNTGVTVFHSGDVNAFTSNANIHYMDNKNIDGKIEFSSRNGMKLSSELTTPFKNFESTSVKVNHDVNDYSGDVSGNAGLTTTIGKFGNGEITYSKTGSLDNLVLDGSVSSNGRDVAVLKVTNNMQTTEMHSMYSLKSVATPDMYFSMDHSGDSFSFNTKTMGKIGQNMVSTDANMKRTYDTLSADGSITYRLQGKGKNVASITLLKDGPLDNCNMALTGEFNKDEVKLSASRSGAFNDMHFSGSAGYNRNSFDVSGTWKNTDNIEGTLKVLTPLNDFKEAGLVFSHSGDMSDFTSSFNADFMDRNVASINVQKNGPLDNCNMELTGKVGNDEVKLSASRSGALNNMRFSGSAGFNTKSVDVNGMWKNTDNIKGSLKVLTPFDNFNNMGMEISHSGDMMSELTSSFNVDFMNKNVAFITLQKDGPSDNCNMALTGKVSNNEVKLSASRSGAFNDMHFSGSAGYNRKSFDVSGTWKNTDNIEGTLKVLTPLNDFKEAGLVFSHSGDLMSDVTSSFNVDFMDRNVASINIQKNGPSDNCNMALTGKVGNDEVKLSASRSGALNNMRFSGSAGFNAKSVDINGIWKNTDNIEGSLKVLTPFDYFNNMGMDISHSGDMSSDVSSSFNVDFMKTNVASINLQKNGPSDNCNMELTGKVGNDEVKLSASRSGAFNNMRFGGSAGFNTKSVDVNGIWKSTDSIKGNLKVLTPFDNFNKMGLGISHSGDVSDFTTSFNINFMDDKEIHGKVDLTASSLSNIKFVTELMTPFENFETLNMKFDNNYDTYYSSLNGNAAIDTTIAGFGTGSIVYSKIGNLDNLEVTGNALRNGVDVAELKITNRLQDQEVHSSFDYKSTATPRVLLTLDHSGDIVNMKSSARAEIGKRNIITVETTLSQRSSIMDAEGKLMYNIRKFGSNQLSLTLHKEGQLNNFNVEITGKNGAKTSKITGNFKNTDELTGAITVNTPVDGFNNVGMSFKHSGSIDRFNCEGKMTLTDGEEFSGKIDFYRHQLRRIEAVIELNTPISDLEFTKFEYRHEGESDSFTCSSSLQYGNSQRITYDMSANSSPKPEMTITLKTPQEQFTATGSYETTWPRYAINGKVDAGHGNAISVDGSLDASDDIVGALTLSTPFDDFNNVGISFHHTPKSNGMESEGRITYMDGKVISGKADAKMKNNGGDASMEFRTPFSGYEFTRFETKNVANKRIVKTVTKFVYGNNERMTVDAYTKFKPTPEFSFTISCPRSQDIEAFVSFDNTWPKYELTARMTPGNGDRFTLGGNFDVSKDISGSLKVETPFENFNKIGMNFIHSGDNEKFGTEGTVTYMDGQEIFGKVDFYRYMWRRVDASMELNTPFSGMETTKAEVNFEDNSNSISTTAALEYNNGQKVNGNVKVTYSPSYDVSVTLNTPDNVIKVQGALDLTAPNYEALSSLDYGSGNVYSANGKFNFYSANNLDGSMEVNTPLSGFEYTKAEYQHKLDSSELTGSVSLTYDDGKKMSCDVKSTLSPNFDGTVTVKTPFEGFENMQGSATFESSYNRYESSSTLNFGQGSMYSMTSELDYSIEPMKASTKISTPFENFRNVELNLNHEGGLTNFRTTGFLSSPLTNHVNAKASLRYDAVMDMAAAASLQTSLEGFDDLKAELKTSDVAGEMKTNALFGWTSGQQVTVDGTFRQQEGWSEDKMHADVSIATPFVAVRSVNMQMDHSAGSDRYSQTMNFELNGDSLLDYDAEYNFNEKKTAELLVRQPWPMQYTASLSGSEAEVFANWDRNEADSNVRVQATMTDTSDSYQTQNDLDLSVIYASRKVGIVNHLSHGSSQLLSNGHVYWDSDDDSKVSYDLQVTENNRRRKQIVDGSFKLGLPTRTIGVTGSYSKNAALVSSDVAFSWDMDRDQSKQVGVKTNVRLGDNLKGDVTLSMPSLRKEIRVDGEVMLNNGRVILDTKTDISYSRDASKTLTLTSKLEDISTRYNNFNYSLALGLKHAHTNVEIGMNSHIGSSDDSMTFGLSSNYMTSKRQMKNLALLSEINVLKKQISVQVFNPVNSIEVVGDIVSETPYKMRLMNKIDGEETFRSDVTFDKTMKSLVFNTFTDSDILTLAAKYPNSSAFRVDFTRHTHDYDQQEALLAVRLNTSRLLHTRLSWRPEMMQDFKNYAVPKVMEMSESAILGFASFNEVFAEELTSKYSAIANEMSQELQPFINALDEELALVAEKMTELSDELKKMYENNDLYIQNMGEGVLKLQAEMERLSREYTTTYTQLISSLREKLYEMRRYNAGAHYKHFVTQTSATLVSESMKTMASLELYMAEVDQVLREYKESMVAMKQKAMDTIYNATYVDYLSNQIPDVETMDISPYISSFHLPDQYTNVIYDIPSNVNAMLDRSNIPIAKEGFNEVYQQGVWAYNYWQLEENLEKHAKNILKTLKEIVEEELKECAENTKNLLQNPITVWDPEHGEIQAEFPLPIAVRRLDQVPDMKPLISKLETFADTYFPDENTWDNLVESVSEMLPAESPKSNETGDGLDQQLSKYRPSKKYRKKGRKYKVKRSRQ